MAASFALVARGYEEMGENLLRTGMELIEGDAEHGEPDMPALFPPGDAGPFRASEDTVRIQGSANRETEVEASPEETAPGKTSSRGRGD
jgi:hypothetical protein